MRIHVRRRAGSAGYLQVVISCLLLLSLCTPSALTAEVTEIRIGATLPLSGKLAFIGTAYLRGVELAIEDLNNDPELNTKWRFSLTVDDNRGEPTVAAAGAKKLLDVDGVNLLMANTTHLTTAVAPIAEQRDRILFYSSTSPEIAHKHANAFRDYLDAEDNARELAAAVLKRGVKRVAILSEQSDACILFLNAFKSETGGKVTVVAEDLYSAGETNFKPLLVRSAAKSPDGYLLCVWRDVPNVMRQLKELNLQKIPTFQLTAPFLPVADTQEMRALFEENKTISTWYALPAGESDPAQAAFNAQFAKRYGETPRPDSAYSYDELLFFGRALRSCGTFSNDCVMNFLKQNEHIGASGPLKFTPDRISKRPVFLMEVAQGNWRTIPSGKIE